MAKRQRLMKISRNSSNKFLEQLWGDDVWIIMTFAYNGNSIRGRKADALLLRRRRRFGEGWGLGGDLLFF